MPSEDKNMNTLRTGTECWAWRYDVPNDISIPVARMAPTRGILSDSPNQVTVPDDGSGWHVTGPNWFVPYSGKSRKPAFTKAVGISFVNLCPDKQSAVESYNKAVALYEAKFLDYAAMIHKDLV